MNELFTFNSQQFRMIQPPPNTSRSIRKRFLSSFGIRRTSSLRSDSTACEHLQSIQGTKAGCKKVQFDLVPFSKMKKHSSQVDSFMEEIMQKPQKIVPKNSKRYYDVTDNKKSLQLERKGSFEEKINYHKVNSSMDVETFQRKQKRVKSLRVGPKIVIPISDRKLPKVFKMNSPIYQPNIISENQAKRKLIESRQIRESFSSQKARVILKYGENMFKITKKQPSYNESQTLPKEM